MSLKPLVVYVRAALIQIGREWRARQVRKAVQAHREAT